MKNEASKKQCKKKYKVIIAVRDELFGDAILDFVREHAWPAKTQFHLVFVIEPNPLKNALIIPQEVVDEIERDERATGYQVLNYMARALYKALPGVRVKRHLRAGFPKHELIDLCNKLSADLIVLGSHSRRGIDRLLIGSVANAVASHSPCSSVVIRLTDAQLKQDPPFDFTSDDIPERMKEDVEIVVPSKDTALVSGKQTKKH